jgi:hypothetical protein
VILVPASASVTFGLVSEPNGPAAVPLVGPVKVPDT